MSHSFVDILRQRTRDVEVKRYCVTLLEKLGSFKYTRETLDTLDKEARNEVAQLGPNPIMEKLLEELLSWKDTSGNN
jgi:geranylgeranyl diphosphate synthase type 3